MTERRGILDRLGDGFGAREPRSGVLPFARRGGGAALVAATLALPLSACGGRATLVTRTANRARGASRVEPRRYASAADVRFARLLLAYAQEDAAAAVLASRKFASPALATFASRRVRQASAESAAAARFLTRAGHSASPLRLPIAQRLAWQRDYMALVANAGWRFDVAYVTVTRSRSLSERVLFLREARAGTAPAARRLARLAARTQAADAAELQRITG